MALLFERMDTDDLVSPPYIGVYTAAERRKMLDRLESMTDLDMRGKIQFTDHAIINMDMPPRGMLSLIVWYDQMNQFNEDISVFDNDPFGTMAKYPIIIDRSLGSPRYGFAIPTRLSSDESNPPERDTTRNRGMYSLVEYLIDKDFKMYGDEGNVNYCHADAFAKFMCDYFALADDSFTPEITRWARSSIVQDWEKHREKRHIDA